MRPAVNIAANAVEPPEVLLRPILHGSHHHRVPTGYGLAAPAGDDSIGENDMIFASHDATQASDTTRAERR